MSVHDMQPQFKDYQGYQEWRSGWRELYAHASSEVRQGKLRIKSLQRQGVSADLSRCQKEQHHRRAIARKLMTALETARIRWTQIKAMRAGVREQASQFPLEVEGKNIDFHFNKKSNEFDFIPMWVIKCRGKSWYVNHLDCQAGFTTRESPDHPSTRGSLRVKRGTLSIDAEGNAVIQ